MSKAPTAAQKRHAEELSKHIAHIVPRGTPLALAPLLIAADGRQELIREVIFGSRRQTDERSVETAIFQGTEDTLAPTPGLLDTLNQQNWGYADGCSALILNPALVLDGFTVRRGIDGKILFRGTPDDWECGVFAKAENAAFEYTVAYDMEKDTVCAPPSGRCAVRDVESHWRRWTEFHMVAMFAAELQPMTQQEMTGVTFAHFEDYVAHAGMVPSKTLIFIATKV